MTNYGKNLYSCGLWLLWKILYPNKYPNFIYLKPLYDCCHEGLLFISLINAIQMFHNLQKAIRQEWLSQNTLLRAHYICKYGFHLLICFVQFRVLSFASHVLCLLVHFEAGRKWIAVIRSILRLPDKEKCAILRTWENHRAKGGFTPLVFCGGFK